MFSKSKLLDQLRFSMFSCYIFNTIIDWIYFKFLIVMCMEVTRKLPLRDLPTVWTADKWLPSKLILCKFNLVCIPTAVMLVYEIFYQAIQLHSAQHGVSYYPTYTLVTNFHCSQVMKADVLPSTWWSWFCLSAHLGSQTGTQTDHCLFSKDHTTWN